MEEVEVETGAQQLSSVLLRFEQKTSVGLQSSATARVERSLRLLCRRPQMKPNS
jgi:hypothetical protein